MAAGPAGGAFSNPTGVSGIVPPMPTTGQPTQAQIPFRAASPQKTLVLSQTSQTLATTAIAQGPDTIQGEGYIEDLAIRISHAVASGNAATVAYTEDGIQAAILSVIFNGPGGDIINLPGEQLAKMNMYDGKQLALYGSSSDVGINQALTGSGGTGGSWATQLRVPIATGYRALVGLLGNQDKATKYRIRNDLNASGQIFSTAPTALATAILTRYYTERAVPGASDNYGNAQQQQPDGYGIIHYIFAEQASNPPAPGTIKHYVQGLGNTVRTIMLSFRQNNSRSSAESTLNVNNAPASITWFLGDNPIFSEDYALRRRIMYDRYGFDSPNGVLVYSWAGDFAARIGEELADDLLNTQNLVTMSVQITYPSGIGSTNNSLWIAKDTLWVPSTVNLPSVMMG